jgi:hypothetical protein
MRKTFRWISIEATLPNGKVESIRTSKRGRISRFIQRVKKLEPTEYRLKVIYDRITDNYGQEVLAQNSGDYKTIKELKHALACFIEK